ncbi:Putative sporulation transcription regulator WhiA [Corynebacterium deserti GIMN1.010]|uniref:Probable cell division protein WhiA n=1 Tax=Corynebacterium deserti GIMN1.010 TaxID=931089 RepID=A0A0M4CQ82_9CORY|nr:DNA-binding protein WhiA [Corynebacterium deserti]ALC05992.1 Putative sporulation transcription regulator WhiA [Corynebacterium deserti GIMN1.010]
MSLTSDIKKELATVSVTKQSAKAAEVSALLRFAGEMQSVGGRLVIEANVDSLEVGQRLQKFIHSLYSADVALNTVNPTGTRKTPKYLIRIIDNADEIARRTGLVTRSGHVVKGLAPSVVSGTISDAEAAWRGAFLAGGSLSDPGRSSSLEVLCPGQETALALVGCARRIGVTAKTKDSRGNDRAIVRDAEAIGALLTRIGAQKSRLLWEEKRLSRDNRTPANRLANFDDANLRRSARAAVVAAARVDLAMKILGDDVPEHLAEAGQLRVQHRAASLEELGRLADPQMTKDAVAGRIRRLLTMADKRAEELGIADTSSAVTEDLMEEM